MLPASQTLLKIHGFPNLERLSSSMYHQNLSSLKLWSCPKLKCFPGKGLPCSLLVLDIWEYPLDGRKVQRESRIILAFVNPYTSRQYKIEWILTTEMLFLIFGCQEFNGNLS